jgi:hypothetical protein
MTRALRLIVLCAMLLGLPLLGIVIAGKPVGPYLEFPPKTHYVEHAPFSWAAFIALAAFLIVVISPFVIQGMTGRQKASERPSVRSWRLPWWGWAGMVWTVAAWVVAWNRFSWVGPLQRHTFFPLWAGYILVVNALTYHRTGRCPLTDRTGSYLVLFPLSAAFWWFFEYLNRFVQNWYYVGSDFDAWAYFWYATLSFSTVLPAVLATREWIHSFSWPSARFRDVFPIRMAHPRAVSGAVLVVAGAGLAGIGVWPNLLFPLLWVSPMLILVSLQGLASETNVFSPVAQGAWDGIVTAAVAALVCGVFWEMWNAGSCARWIYTIPYVHRFQVFEMPILGYAGYLPFGVECVIVMNLLTGEAGGNCRA